MGFIMFLLVNEWTMYLWPNVWNGSWCVEASMFLSDSQLSMKPLFSYMLFRHVDYIFGICLTKYLSWLVGVQSRFYSSDWIRIIISLLIYCSEDVIPFLVVTWVLGLKKRLKSQGHWYITMKKGPWMLACVGMGSTGLVWG